jgi:hypothetical protein
MPEKLRIDPIFGGQFGIFKEIYRVRSIRVLPRVFGLTLSRSRNSATPLSYECRSSL